MQKIKVLFFFALVFVFVNLLAQNKSLLFKPNSSNFFIYMRGNKSFIINQNKVLNKSLNKTLNQLSSGKRLNTFKDNPASMAVLEKINSILNEMKQKSMNIANLRNYFKYIEGVIARDMRLVNRIELLINRSGNGILTAEDRGYNQTEINQLLRQINMNARFSQFNKISVIPQLTTKNLGIDKVDVVHHLYKSYDMIKAAQKKLLRRRVLQGVKSNILTFRIKGVALYYVNLAESASRMGDMDISEGVTELMKNSIRLKFNNGILIKRVP